MVVIISCNDTSFFLIFWVFLGMFLGMTLKIAAKIDKVDREYFHNEVEPLFNNRFVEYVGEIGEREKNEFLGNAYAFLFPINWREPFGLVMIESMACGTPVIAFREGSVPEVMKDGVTGYIVGDVESAVTAVQQVPALSRKICRRYFEDHFTASRMALDYAAIYRRLIDRQAENAVA